MSHIHIVEVTDPAYADAQEYFEFIREHSHDDEAAVSWWNGLLDAMQTLESLPGRCARIPEHKKFSRQLHQLLYQSHRIIFEVESELVTVLRIYHASRRPLKTLRSGHRKPA
jgi:toxin ParE1/3/4